MNADALGGLLSRTTRKDDHIQCGIVHQNQIVAHFDKVPCSFRRVILRQLTKPSNLLRFSFKAIVTVKQRLGGE